MPRIIFVRPGETDYSQHNVLLGRHDADLNEAGHREAEYLGEFIAPYHPTYLAASPLKRALSTAMAIEDACHGLTTYPVHAFQGIDYGEWEAKTAEFIQASDHRRYISWLSDPDFRTPGGESMREVYARAFPELVNLVHHAEEHETLVLVLQESVIKALVCAVLDLPLENANRFSINPGAYAVFERLFEDGPYQMISWNVKAHICTTTPDFEEIEEPVVAS